MENISSCCQWKIKFWGTTHDWASYVDGTRWTEASNHFCI
jgi:hypothetical protein